jgi:heat shock protein 1/8
MRAGLAHALAESHDDSVSGRMIDDALLKFFAKDFTKKLKTPLVLSTDSSGTQDKEDQRAESKLRIALEHTRRTVAASPGAASCAVKCLKAGLDYAGTVNRMRFDMEAKPVYAKVVQAITALLEGASFDAHQIDTVVFVGGAGCLPGLQDAVLT